MKTQQFHINANPPGVGKSYNERMSIAESKIKAAIFSKEHGLLDEYEQDIKNARHIYGWNQLCRMRNIVPIKTLNQHGVPPSLICQSVGHICKKGCGYQNQFNRLATKTTLAPFQFFTDSRLKLDKHNIILLDENTDSVKELTYNPHEVGPEIQKLNSYQITNAIIDHNLEYLESVKLARKIMICNLQVLEDNRYDICKLVAEDVFNYLKIERAYPDTRKTRYYYPAIFDVFKSGRNIRLLSATFNETHFKLMADRYRTEFDPDYQYSITYEPTITPTSNSYVIKVGTSNWHKSSMFHQSTLDKASKELQKVRDIHYNDKICVLTYKDLIIDGEFLGFPAFHFGADKGVNSWKDYQVLVVFGTYMFPPEAYEVFYETLYPGAEVPDFSKVSTINKHNINLPVGYEWLWEMYSESQVYDSIHRVRPFNDDRVIYAYGHVPAKIATEFKVLKTQSAAAMPTDSD